MVKTILLARSLVIAGAVAGIAVLGSGAAWADGGTTPPTPSVEVTAAPTPDASDPGDAGAPIVPTVEATAAPTPDGSDPGDAGAPFETTVAPTPVGSDETAIPTAVPAGNGGQGGTTGGGTIGTEVGAGVAGAGLLAFGGIGLARRRRTSV